MTRPSKITAIATIYADIYCDIFDGTRNHFVQRISAWRLSFRNSQNQHLASDWLSQQERETNKMIMVYFAISLN